MKMRTFQLCYCQELHEVKTLIKACQREFQVATDGIYLIDKRDQVGLSRLKQEKQKSLLSSISESTFQRLVGAIESYGGRGVKISGGGLITYQFYLSKDVYIALNSRGELTATERHLSRFNPFWMYLC